MSDTKIWRINILVYVKCSQHLLLVYGTLLQKVLGNYFNLLAFDPRAKSITYLKVPWSNEEE